MNRREFVTGLTGLTAASTQLAIPSQVDWRMLARALPTGLAMVAAPDLLGEPWRMAPHLELLTKTLVDLEQRRIRRLIVEMPPRHGKSQLCSVFFPAWYLGRHPGHRVMIASEEIALAAEFSAKARTVLERFGPDVFGVRPHLRRTRSVDWIMEGTSGRMMAAGIKTGGLTGRGANLLIVDDPIKNVEGAMSETYRQRVWDWFVSTARSRLEPGGVMIVIMCMTGDTPVLLADGTERPLRDIRPGDRVATFDDGRLGVSTIKHHRSNGLDLVYKIKTISGRTVRANERHPFLVEQNGAFQWVRVRDLTTAHKIVTVKGSGGSGGAKRARLMDATSLPSVGGSAIPTTANRCGPADIGLHPSTQSHGAALGSSTDTASRRPSTTRSFSPKTANVPSVASRPDRTSGPTGAGSSVSTTATLPTASEPSSATTAISPWAMRSLPPPLKLSPTTSDFTSEQIQSIEPDGVEEVFDVEVDRTENFIANGLCSHNTRWHEDDLVGRILKGTFHTEWTRVRLPALAEEDDPLGRPYGEPLWPWRMSKTELEDIAATSEYWWNAMYQQRPRPPGGAIAKVGFFPPVAVVPDGVTKVRFWDIASTEGARRADPDYTVGALVSRHNATGKFTIEHIVRGRWSPADVHALILGVAKQDGRRVAIREEQEPGASGKAVIAFRLQALAGWDYAGVPSTGDKETRWRPFLAQAEAGHFRVLDPGGASGQGSLPWVKAFMDEALSAPYGTHDDQMDAVAGAFNALTEHQATSIPGLVW